MTTHDNRRVVRRVFEEAINLGQLGHLDELIDASYESPDGATGPDAFRRPIQALRAGFPDIHFTLEDLVAEGDRVAVCWTWRGTHAGQFLTFAATGIRVTDRGMAFYRLRAGKVTAARALTDRLGVLEQLGAVPPLTAAS